MHSSDISDIFCSILTFLDWHPDHFWSLAWHSPWHSGSWVKLPVPQWIYQAWNWPWGTDTWREKTTGYILIPIGFPLGFANLMQTRSVGHPQNKTGWWFQPLLKNISQLGWLFPIYGKIKQVPNHQPENYTCSRILFQRDWVVKQQTEITWKLKQHKTGMWSNKHTMHF